MPAATKTKGAKKGTKIAVKKGVKKAVCKKLTNAEKEASGNYKQRKTASGRTAWVQKSSYKKKLKQTIIKQAKKRASAKK